MNNINDIIVLLLIEEAKDRALVPLEPKKTYENRRDKYIEKRQREIAQTLVEASK